jgi:hypothetical protein
LCISCDKNLGEFLMLCFVLWALCCSFLSIKIYVCTWVDFLFVNSVHSLTLPHTFLHSREYVMWLLGFFLARTLAMPLPWLPGFLPLGPQPCNPFVLVASPKLGLWHELTIFSCKHLFNVHTIFVAIVSIANLIVVTSNINILPSTNVRCFQLTAPMSSTLLLSSLLGFVSALGAVVVMHLVAPLCYANHHHSLYFWK